jgi:hypothetical protein
MRRSRVIGVLVAGLLAAAAVPARGSAAVAYYEISPPAYFNGSFNQCLDVPGGSINPAVRLQLFHCHGFDSNGAMQLWQFIHVGTDSYRIVNKKSGLCLTAGGEGNGSAVFQDYCGQTITGDVWQVDAEPISGHVRLMNRVVGLCLAAANYPGGGHTAVVVRSCAALQESPQQTFLLG